LKEIEDENVRPDLRRVGETVDPRFVAIANLHYVAKIAVHWPREIRRAPKLSGKYRATHRLSD
jgi:hypothetical protein